MSQLGERKYVKLEVSLYAANRTPEEMRQLLDELLHKHLNWHFQDDIEVLIVEHSGTCEDEVCP